MAIPEAPANRTEEYLNAIALRSGGGSATTPEEPANRIEQYLEEIAENVSGGGGGGGGDSVSPYTSNPAALGTASPGSSAKYARGDHVHPKPSASDIGALPDSTVIPATAADVGAIAAPALPTAGQVLVYDGAAWTAKTETEEVTIATAGAVTQSLDAGKIYHFTGALTALTITLNAAASGVISQYHFDFDSGSTAPTLTVPSSVTMPDSFTVGAGTHYEVDILNNYGAVVSWPNS